MLDFTLRGVWLTRGHASGMEVDGDYKVRGKVRARQKERRLRRETKIERGHKHRLVNNEGEQRFCARREQIAQKAIFSPLELPCTLGLVSTACVYSLPRFSLPLPF